MRKAYTGAYIFHLDDSGKAYSAELTRGAKHLLFPAAYRGKPVTCIWASETGPENRDDVQELTVPEGITSLEGPLLECFPSLQRISLPKSLTYISADCISGCHRLAEINADSESTCFKTVEGHLLSKDGSVFIKAAPARLGTHFTLPTGVEKVADRAFEGCRELLTLTLPEAVVEIGSAAFASCTSLKRITLPTGLKQIGSLAFSYCTALERITLPKAVAQVGYHLFFHTGKALHVTCEADCAAPGWDDDWSEGVNFITWGTAR